MPGEGSGASPGSGAPGDTRVPARSAMPPPSAWAGASCHVSTRRGGARRRSGRARARGGSPAASRIATLCRTPQLIPRNGGHPEVRRAASTARARVGRAAQRAGLAAEHVQAPCGARNLQPRSLPEPELLASARRQGLPPRRGDSFASACPPRSSLVAHAKRHSSRWLGRPPRRRAGREALLDAGAWSGGGGFRAVVAAVPAATWPSFALHAPWLQQVALALRRPRGAAMAVGRTPTPADTARWRAGARRGDPSP